MFLRASTAAAFAFLGLVASPMAAMAQLDQKFNANVGDWQIKGYFLDGGHTAVCNMERAGVFGGTFSYLDAVTSGNDGLKLTLQFVFPTKAPDGTNVVVGILFDNASIIHFSTTASNGYVSVDLPTDTSDLKEMLNSLQTSSVLGEDAKYSGGGIESVEVDLTGSKAAFDRAGLCMHDIIDQATTKLQGED